MDGLEDRVIKTRLASRELVTDLSLDLEKDEALLVNDELVFHSTCRE